MGSKTGLESPVHPRVCGEQNLIVPDLFVRYGSSPRVRGTVHSACEDARSYRFIPACAGNSALWAHTSFPMPVHPRVCGEQNASSGNDGYSRGSSPRVRGTGVVHAAHQACCRFIPACAGNSSYNLESSHRSAVHPRVCGEQTCLRSITSPSSGSSPRVRGTAGSAW